MANSISASVIQNYTAISNTTGRSEIWSSGTSVSNIFNEVYKSYFHDYLAEAIKERTEGISKKDLVAQLKTLIATDSENSEDSDNSEEIAIVTNLISDFNNLSRGGNVITKETVAASKGYEA